MLGIVLIYSLPVVCDGATRVEAYQKLNEIVEDMVGTAEEQGPELPEARTRAMREVEIAA